MFRIRRFRSRQIYLIALVFCASLLVPSGPAIPQAAPESVAAQVVAQIKARMPDWIKQRETPGAAVAALKAAELIRSQEVQVELVFQYS